MKRTVYIGLLFISMLLFNSCLTLTLLFTRHYKHVDKTTAPETKVTVLFDQGLMVHECNGETVYDAWYKRGWTSLDTVLVDLPGGETEIVFDMNYVHNSTTYKAEKIRLSYFLVPGKTYTIRVDRKGYFFKSPDIAISLYDNMKYRKGTLVKSWPLEF
jgi:hypothetical protein